MSNGNELKKMLSDILATTMKIRNRFPQLYQLLEETPLFFSADKKKVSLHDFEEYLNTIQTQLKEHIRHENN